jgi:enoyl-CoA hydratase/carnithine racemase
MPANISIVDEGGVRRITIARAHKANALRPEECAAIQHAVEEASTVARVIVFRGEGVRSFSAGMDVAAFLGLDTASARKLIESVRGMLHAVRTSPLPTIAAINGACIGAALELAAACDFRIAVDTAVFGLPEVKLGIPSVLDAALLQQYVGLSLAREMILFGDLYPAARMAGAGFLNRMVTAAELDDAVRDTLARLLPLTRTVLAAQKRLFEVWQNHGLEAANRISVDVFAGTFDEPETITAIEAYGARIARRS